MGILINEGYIGGHGDRPCRYKYLLPLFKISTIIRLK